MRLEVAMKLRQCIEQLGGKAVDLFQIIAKGEDVASVEEAGVDSGVQAESVFQGEKGVFCWLFACFLLFYLLFGVVLDVRHSV